MAKRKFKDQPRMASKSDESSSNGDMYSPKRRSQPAVDEQVTTSADSLTRDNIQPWSNSNSALSEIEAYDEDFEEDTTEKEAQHVQNVKIINSLCGNEAQQLHDKKRHTACILEPQSSVSPWLAEDLDYEPRRTAISHLSSKPSPQVNGPVTSGLPSGDSPRSISRERYHRLALLHKRMADAELKAPRPFLEQLLLHVEEAMALPTGSTHRLLDNEELQNVDLEILEQLTGPSWSEMWQEYPDPIPGLPSTEDVEKFHKFEKLVMKYVVLLPLWRPAKCPPTPHMGDTRIGSVEYDSTCESQMGVPVQAFIQDSSYPPPEHLERFPYTGSIEDATRYLTILHSYGRIHFDNNNSVSTPKLSRVPLTGHPEHRNLQPVWKDSSPAWRRLCTQKGTNVDFWKRLSFRLGRDLVAGLRVLAGEDGSGGRRVPGGSPHPSEPVVSETRTQDEGRMGAVKDSTPGIEVTENSQKAEKIEEFWDGVPRERYVGAGQRAFYPFGETPYQEWWLSRRMEMDLADVPEFHVQRGGSPSSEK